jgi:N-methylhydantoinase B
MTVNDEWRQHGYLPPDELTISPKLLLHTDSEPELDPVTYEVIRYNLWNTNLEHGQTMINVSGSPIAAYAHDFNPTILTHDGEYVFYGPYIQFLSSSADLTVKWLLEHRSADPGIGEGDIWVSNDVWIGGTHQMDLVMCAPVFHEGRLFCWVTNTMHQLDLGGDTPGGFSTNASNVFDEARMFSPVRLVQNDEFRRDVEESITRSSRLPDVVALDLRAEVAGCNVAARRIKELVERYGPAVVKGVMHRVIQRAEEGFKEKLAELPDGTWRERGYVDQAGTGDRGAHRIEIQVTKRGDILTFTNHGTAAPLGSANTAVGGWRGAILNAVSTAFGYDQLFAPGGIIKHLRFEPERNTMVSAPYPASVSNAPSAMQFTIGLAGNCLARTLSSSERLKEHINAIGSCSFSPLTTISGVDEDGTEHPGGLLVDIILGGIGAFSRRDGIPTGGITFDPIGRTPAVEQQESVFPILYLYRKQLTDSGGAGKFARGTSSTFAIVPHGVSGLRHDIVSHGTALPSAPGLFGGRPGGENRMLIWRGTRTRKLLSAGVIPQSHEEAEAERVELLPPRTVAHQQQDDVFVLEVCGGAGYGDPLERDPEKVLDDVASKLSSAQTAAGVYGVILADDGAIDRSRTATTRHELLAARLGAAASSDQAAAKAGADTEPLLRVGEYLHVVRVEGRATFACAACGTELGGVGDNYKDSSTLHTKAIQEAGPFADPAASIDATIEFREFSCPGCGVLFDAEVARQEDPPLWDVQLQVG